MLANSTAAAKKTDQPGIWEIQKSYLLIPENSKTFLILSQPKMCLKYTFLLPRAHFLGATGAPTEPVHESLLKTPILSRPTGHSSTSVPASLLELIGREQKYLIAWVKGIHCEFTFFPHKLFSKLIQLLLFVF